MAKQQRQYAFIRADECIGCAQCLPHCPVDAIIGTEKHLHVVLEKECIGCELCIAPCPVDCIEIRNTLTHFSDTARMEMAQLAKKRFLARQQRLSQKRLLLTHQPLTPAQKKEVIAAALLRVKKNKRESSQ